MRGRQAAKGRIGAKGKNAPIAWTTAKGGKRYTPRSSDTSRERGEDKKESLNTAAKEQ